MFTGVIVDVVIAVLIVASAIVGVSRGFFISVTKPIKWFAAIFLAFALCGTVASDIIQPLIEAPITNQITVYLSEKCAHITTENLNAELPTLLKLAAGLVDVDINTLSAGSSEELIGVIVDALAVPLIHIISVIISFFTIYVLSKLALALVIAILNQIFDAGIFGVMNKILGFVFGTAFGIIIAWVFVVFFTFVISLESLSDVAWIAEFKGGALYGFFKSMSPLDLLLSF